MIRLLNCFHILADPEFLSDDEWREGCSAGNIDTSYIKKTINASDESALELSCRFRDQDASEECVCLAALTIGDKTNSRILKTLSAIGFDRTIRIENENVSGIQRMSSEQTALIISEWIRKTGEFDIIITGQQSGDGNHGKVPSLIAETLDISCITGVTGFTPADKNGAYVSWLSDGTIIRAYVRYPVVLSVGIVSDAYLRVPTIKQRMAPDQAVTETISADDFCSDDSMRKREPVLLSMEPIVERREAVLIDGSEADKAARVMSDKYRKWVAQ